jgi:hypothetical protein
MQPSQIMPATANVTVADRGARHPVTPRAIVINSARLVMNTLLEAIHHITNSADRHRPRFSRAEHHPPGSTKTVACPKFGLYGAMRDSLASRRRTWMWSADLFIRARP